MSSTTEILNAVVVGAGQCGLGVSYHLTRAGVPHRVLEGGRVAESWRTQRWDSFRMNTCNALTAMPGSTYESPDPEGFMTGQEFGDLLADFAVRHALPVETGTPVRELVRDERAGAYRLATPRDAILARNVVLASGCQNRTRIPALACSLPASLEELHAADYRRPDALPAGAVLVVGTAASGCQIAEDLLDAGRTVFLATSRVGRLPRRHRGRDTQLWLRDAGILDQGLEEVDPALRRRTQPQMAAGHTVSLQSLSARGAVLLGRLIGNGGGVLIFADDLEENIRYADEVAANFRRMSDEHIARAGLDAPAAEPDPAETVAPRLPDPPIRALHPAREGVSAVVWCTGFRGDYGWVRLPGVLDHRGAPAHERGAATACPGIYFIGLPWLSARKSTLVFGVDDDARRIATQIAAALGR